MTAEEQQSPFVKKLEPARGGSGSNGGPITALGTGDGSFWNRPKGHYLDTESSVGPVEVIGYLLVGQDGLLERNCFPAEFDAESMAVWSLAIFMASEMTCRKMGSHQVFQLILKVSSGHFIIDNLGDYLILVHTSGTNACDLELVLNNIAALLGEIGAKTIG